MTVLAQESTARSALMIWMCLDVRHHRALAVYPVTSIPLQFAEAAERTLYKSDTVRTS